MKVGGKASRECQQRNIYGGMLSLTTTKATVPVQLALRSRVSVLRKRDRDFVYGTSGYGFMSSVMCDNGTLTILLSDVICPACQECSCEMQGIFIVPQTTLREE